MATKTIDMRGRPCPEPVVESRKALAQPDIETLIVVVDNEASAQNVTRMATSMGFGSQVDKASHAELQIVINKQAPTSPSVAQDKGEASPDCAAPPWVVVLIASSRFGEGDETLGAKLMHGFIKTIKELQPRPECLIFINSGVHLVTAGSAALDALRELSDLGIQILACGTCLDHYQVREKVEVGNVSNMLEIASSLISADRVVRL